MPDHAAAHEEGAERRQAEQRPDNRPEDNKLADNKSDDNGTLHVVLFFTWDVSLALWRERGLLAREVHFYKTLAARGVRVTFLTWGGAEDLEIARALPGIRVIPVYTVVRKARHKVLRWLQSFAVPFVFYRQIKSAHVMKTNQMWGGWCAVIAKYLVRRPLIVRAGYELHQFTVRQGHKKWRCRFVWALSFLTYRAADAVCLPTPEDGAYVRAHFLPRGDKIFCHPNWIDTDLFRPMPDIPRADGRVLYVGRLAAQKNVSLLIAALQGTGYELDIIGAGELQDDLEMQAILAGVTLNFLGSYANDELPFFYNRYPVFVLPSLYEGNPKTLLEAMACGGAVIGTDVPGVAPLIVDAVSGVLVPSTPADLRAAIVRLMGDEDLQSRLGRAARQQILDTQSLAHLIDQEVALYGSVTGRVPAANQGERA